MNFAVVTGHETSRKYLRLLSIPQVIGVFPILSNVMNHPCTNGVSIERHRICGCIVQKLFKAKAYQFHSQNHSRTPIFGVV